MNNRYDSEVGGTAGGALSIVTRGGTNRMAGTAFGFYRADDLREPGAREQEGADFSRAQYGFTLDQRRGVPLRTDAGEPQPVLVRNPDFGRFRATLPGREIQLGLKWVF